jgi:hypothetical protein
MQNTISLDDVIASETKFGCVLEYDLKKVRDLKTLNPKSKYDTTYIPLLFKHVNGKSMRVKIKFSEIMISSGAKIPQGSDDGGIAKNLNISFMKMSKTDIEGGDYEAKEKDSEEKQEKENKRISDNIARYEQYNAKFIKVLEIIDSSYKSVCEDLKKKENLPFRIKKDRKQTDVVIYSMKQVTRLNKETNTDDALENPIYRLKVSVCMKDNCNKGQIGIWSTYNNEFKPTVFDARKMTKKNNYQPVPAKVKVGGKLRNLDVGNASSFITYKSLIGGSIMFECITASKFGLSLSNSFYDLYVFRHKSKAQQNVITKEEILAMRGGVEEEDEEEEDVEIVESKDNSDEKDAEDEDEEEYDEDENEDDNDEPNDSDDDQSDKKPLGKK